MAPRPARKLTGAALMKQAARQQVNKLVRSGAIPHPADQSCFDCRTEPAAGYDHHRGYDDDHALDVQPVCIKCHAARGVKRGEHASPMNLRTQQFPEPGFRERLASSRIQAGLTVDQAAKNCGVRPSTWAHYEGVSLQFYASYFVARYAAALGVPFEQLWGRTHIYDLSWKLVPVTVEESHGPS